MKITFSDRLTLDVATKKLISLRDGILNYYGAELGIKPHDQVFRVYRSPDTVEALAPQLVNIPITDDHIEQVENIPDGLIKGTILTSTIIESIDESKSQTLCVRNKVHLNDDMVLAIENGKRELSLGYAAELVPATGTDVDYNQEDIDPHHLAIVKSGRCGSQCEFLDRRGTMKSMPNPELQGAGNVVTNDTVQNLGSEMKTEAQMTAEKAKLKDMDKEVKPEDMEKDKEVKAEDMDEDEDEKDKEVKAKDMDLEGKEKEKMKSEDRAVDLKDTQEFKDAVKALADSQNRQYADVFVKSKRFLKDDFDYSGKTTFDIMKEVVVSQLGKEFSDEEIPTAFKTLRKTETYKNFGDSASEGNTFAAVGEKKLS